MMSDNDFQDFEDALKSVRPSQLSSSQVDDALLDCFSGELSSISLPELKESYLDELELQITEAELSAFAPAPLQEELLETLSLAPIEASLRGIELPALSAELIDKFSSAIEASSSIETAEKVIQFPGKVNKGSSWKWYSTAAAVAVFGLIAGFKTMLPGANPIIAHGTTSGNPSSINFDAQPISGEFLNVSTNSTVIKSLDEGLVPNKSKTHYYRAMNVTTMETVVLENEDGERVEVKRPVQRTVLVPAVTD